MFHYIYMLELHEIWLSEASQHVSAWLRYWEFVQESLVNVSEKLWKYMSSKDMTFKPSFYVSASLNSWDPQQNDLKFKFWSFSTKKEQYLGFHHKRAPPITLFLIEFCIIHFYDLLGHIGMRFNQKLSFPGVLLVLWPTVSC